ncbi:uncharacterized protein TEOVI_000039600 [Trypanosoma equiperdum]|uniref:Uncharacterized protein n=2 Tax=Trypanozoon TaxID=39700 RepID=Q38FP3_TRYB2|nr:hypothetical protein, unlikely [Trypanosoma brucei brucei TREU927]EAN76377.1 hypothetical protein, unlikely [Trypanosoma brucei brucei TREU927]SCU67108.1 hypothetical protein, conserved [Trypanosoma equiperdum]
MLREHIQHIRICISIVVSAPGCGPPHGTISHHFMKMALKTFSYAASTTSARSPPSSPLPQHYIPRVTSEYARTQNATFLNSTGRITP